MILHGNNIELLKTLPANSVDSIVTDPPYGLSFMNKHWDYDVPSIELWKECLRVLKPGGHLLSFAGTRTYHRMTVRIEDAGFEIRDMISWIYGSGFPKSLNIGKAIDKIQGSEREFVEEKKKLHISTNATNDGWKRPSHYNTDGTPKNTMTITKGNSKYEGWGTALKPACEPICVARKPVEGTIANNVLQYGAGGINIDGCRIAVDAKDPNLRPNGINHKYTTDSTFTGNYNRAQTTHVTGRFPANIIFDEIAGAMLDEQSGESKSSSRPNSDGKIYNSNTYGSGRCNMGSAPNDKGGASRFFYCAKASKAERNGGLEGFEPAKENLQGLDTRGRTLERQDGSKTLVERWIPEPRANNHPTVKPLKLMQYLVRLVTPKGGVCLDPFAGSGTTGMACEEEGLDYILMEREAEYIPIIKARIEWIKKRKKETHKQTNLFKHL